MDFFSVIKLMKVMLIFSLLVVVNGQALTDLVPLPAGLFSILAMGNRMLWHILFRERLTALGNII